MVGAPHEHLYAQRQCCRSLVQTVDLSFEQHDMALYLSLRFDLIELFLPLYESLPSCDVFKAFWHNVSRAARFGITTMAQPARWMQVFVVCYSRGYIFANYNTPVFRDISASRQAGSLLYQPL